MTTTDQFTAHQSAGSFERGKNLTFTICGGCHYDRQVNKFIGKHLNDLGAAGWELVSVDRTADGVELIFKRRGPMPGSLRAAG